jgi:hypothetical protein
MEKMNQFKNLNYSNKNSDDIIYKIQNSLDRLQTAINNKQIFDNIDDKTNIQNTKNNSNIFNSLINTDKITTERKINQNRLLNQNNFFKKINRTTENKNNPRATTGKNIPYNITNKIKCIKCGNINPPKSKFCFNCGISLNNLEKRPTYSSINTEVKLNNSVFNRNIGDIRYIKDNISQSQVQTKSYNNMNINLNSYANYSNDNKNNINKNNITSQKNIKIINNIYEDLKGIQNEDLINYKKLNDLYLYGDYLEKELKASNDENVKLLEKYKSIKSQVHSLNQKRNKLKQNIDILSKKEKELDKLNTELKNGFNFVEKKFGISDNNNDNNQEKIKLLKDLEANNKKYIEINNEYDSEIENLKNKINALVDNDDDKENDEEEKMIKNLEENNEKEKKELEEKNMLHMLLIKKNELLTLEITNLSKELDLDLDDNNEEEGEEENVEEEEEEKEEEKDNKNKNEENQENNNKKAKEEIISENKNEMKKEEINNNNNNNEDNNNKDINDNNKKEENIKKEENENING